MKKYLLLFIFLTALSYGKGEIQLKKWELKYSYSNIENLNKYFPSVSLMYKNNYTLIYTKEWEENNYSNSSNLLEFYKGNYYLSLGQNENTKLITGIEYYFKTMTFGFRLNKYESSDVLFYKIQNDFYFKNGIIAGARINLIDGDKIELNYMGKIEYKQFSYSHYFDFDALNKGVAEIKLNDINNLYNMKFGYGKDFNKKDDGLSLSIGVKF